MINRLRQKASLGLVILLIICLCSSFTNANVRQVDYAIVSLSQTDDLELVGENISISGDIHTNAGVKIYAESFNMDGICESVKGHDIITSVYEVDTSKFVDSEVILAASNLLDNLKTVAGDTKMVVDVYPDNYENVLLDENIDVQYDSDSGFKVDGSMPFTIKKDMAYIFHDDVTFENGVKIFDGGIIISEGNICIQGFGLDTTDGFSLVYSHEDNILIDSDSEKFNGYFYAPKGNIKFTSANLDIIGQIVADTITLNSDNIKIATRYIPVKEVIEVTPPPLQPSVPIADINGDRAINMEDVIILAKAFNSVKGDEIYNSSCDLNEDGAINMSDVVIIAKFFYSVY